MGLTHLSRYGYGIFYSPRLSVCAYPPSQREHDDWFWIAGINVAATVDRHFISDSIATTAVFSRRNRPAGGGPCVSIFGFTAIVQSIEPFAADIHGSDESRIG